jgi:hypothetical protein
VSPMREDRIRVACVRCDAHRDRTLAPDCMVCGAAAFRVVPPNEHDVDAITREVLAAAELVDVVIHDAAHVGIDPQHPAAIRLAAACRNLALARAGCLGY